MSDRKEKEGGFGLREKASYPYTNMQIRALPGSHVIEVGCLSVESMKNITSPILQNVMNRMNIWLKCG